MTYRDRLRKRWAVVRLLPQMQRIDIGWFYHYSDADGYVRTLRRLDPAGKFEVVFDVSPDASSNASSDISLGDRHPIRLKRTL